MPFIGSLIFREQPDPCIGFKGKSLDDAYVVELITCVSVENHVPDTLICNIACREPTWKSKKPLENNECSFDTFKRCAG